MDDLTLSTTTLSSSTRLGTQSIAQAESAAAAASFDSSSSVITLWVLAGGVIVGVLVIGLICAVCALLNRRYAIQHPKTSKFIPISEKHYHSPSSSSSVRSKNNENHRDSLKEVADKCGWCPTPSAVEVVRTSEGGTKNQLVDSSSCHILIPNLVSATSVESDNSGVFMGEASTSRAGSISTAAGERAATWSTGKRPSMQKSTSHSGSPRASVQIQIQSVEVTSSKYASHGTRGSHSHPLLHPNFHSQSKDDSPGDSEDTILVVSETAQHECSIQVTPSLTSPEGHTTGGHDSALGTGTGSEVFSPHDPCRALWDLRCALENRVSPGESQLLMSISDRSDDGGETVIRLTPYSSLAEDQEGMLRSMDINIPASMLTSLTSFESNTPSDESFDATSCSTALEAIFDEPSDLPLTNQLSGKTASAATSTHLIPPVYKRRKQQSSNQKLTSHQKRQSFKKAHLLAAGPAAASQPVVVAAAPVACSSASPAPKVTAVAVSPADRPVSPSRLVQMKNDSGYKSQSFDASVSHGPALGGQIHSFKSVPILSMVHEASQSEAERNSPSPLLDENADNQEHLTPPNASLQFSTSSEIEEPVALPSLTSSMEVDQSVPLLRTHPATPTSPSASRDWAIDAKSDRLFREFSRPAPGSPLTPRKHRGMRNKLHVRHYSPSSSHSGTPAQASIEETEEEQESSQASACTTIQMVPKRLETDLPDFIFCSTREQVASHISRRSKSPELRHVPIIKLPDQQSDEV